MSARIAKKRHNDAGWRSRLFTQMSFQPQKCPSIMGARGRKFFPGVGNEGV